MLSNQGEPGYQSKYAANMPIFTDEKNETPISQLRNKNINSVLYARALAEKSNLGLMDNRSSSSALDSLRSYGSLANSSPIHSPVRDNVNKIFPSYTGSSNSDAFHSAATSQRNFLDDRGIYTVSDSSCASPYKHLKDLNLQSVDEEDQFLYGDSNPLPEDSQTSTKTSEERNVTSNLGGANWSDDEVEILSNPNSLSGNDPYNSECEELQIIDMKLNPSARKDEGYKQTKCISTHSKELIAKYISDNKQTTVRTDGIPNQESYDFLKSNSHLQSNKSEYSSGLSSKLSLSTNEEYLSPDINRDSRSNYLINVKANKSSSKRTVRVKDSVNDEILHIEKYLEEDMEVHNISSERNEQNEPKQMNRSISLRSAEGPSLPKRYAIGDTNKIPEKLLEHVKKNFIKDRSYSPSPKTRFYEKHLDRSSREKNYRHHSPSRLDHSPILRSRERSPRYQSRIHTPKQYSRSSPKRHSVERSPEQYSRKIARGYYSRERSPKHRSRKKKRTREGSSSRRRSRSRHDRRRSRSPGYRHRRSESRSPRPSWERTPRHYDRSPEMSLNSPISSESNLEISSEDQSVISIRSSDSPIDEKHKKNEPLRKEIKSNKETKKDPIVAADASAVKGMQVNNSKRLMVQNISTSLVSKIDLEVPKTFMEKQPTIENKHVEEEVKMFVNGLQRQKLLQDLVVESAQKKMSQNKPVEGTNLPATPISVSRPQTFLPVTPPFSQPFPIRSSFNMPPYSSIQPGYTFSHPFPPPRILGPYNYPAPLPLSYGAYPPEDTPPAAVGKRLPARVCSLKNIPVNENISVSNNKTIVPVTLHKNLVPVSPTKNIVSTIRNTKDDSGKNSPVQSLENQAINKTTLTALESKKIISSPEVISNRQLISIPVKTSIHSLCKQKITLETDKETQKKENYKKCFNERCILQRTLKNTSNDNSSIRNLQISLEKKQNKTIDDLQNIIKCKTLYDKSQEELKSAIDCAKQKNKLVNDIAETFKPEEVKMLQAEYETEYKAGKYKPVCHDKYSGFDSGNHWCDVCSVEFKTVGQLLTHLYQPEHLQFENPFDPPKEPKKVTVTEDCILRHIKGSEFIKPHYSFFCQLCNETLFNESFAQQHLKGHDHIFNYLEFLKENPVYEKKRNLLLSLKISQMKADKIKRDNEKRQINMEKQRKLAADVDKKVKDKLQEEINREGGIEELEEESHTDSNDSLKKTPGIKLTLVKSDVKKDTEPKKEKLIYIGQMPNYRSRAKLSDKSTTQKTSNMINEKLKNFEEKEEAKHVKDVIKDKDEKIKETEHESQSISSKRSTSVVSEDLDNEINNKPAKRSKLIMSGCQSQSEASFSRTKENENYKNSTNVSKEMVANKTVASNDKSYVSQQEGQICSSKYQLSKINLPRSTSSSAVASNIRKSKSLSEEEKDFLLLGINKSDMVPLVEPRPPPPCLIQKHSEIVSSSQNMLPNESISILKANLPPFPPPLLVPPPDIKVSQSNPPDIKLAPNIPPFPPPLIVPPPEISPANSHLQPDRFNIQTNHPPFPPPLQVPPPNISISNSCQEMNTYPQAVSFVPMSAPVRNSRNVSCDQVAVVDMDIDDDDISENNPEIQVFDLKSKGLIHTLSKPECKKRKLCKSVEYKELPCKQLDIMKLTIKKDIALSVNKETNLTESTNQVKEIISDLRHEEVTCKSTGSNDPSLLSKKLSLKCVDQAKVSSGTSKFCTGISSDILDDKMHLECIQSCKDVLSSIMDFITKSVGNSNELESNYLDCMTQSKVEKRIIIATSGQEIKDGSASLKNSEKSEEIKEAASDLVSESKTSTENEEDTVKCTTSFYSVELSNTETKPETIISSSCHISSPLSDAKGITISNAMSASHSIQPENSFTVVSVMDANEVVSEENQPSVEKEVFSISEECDGMPLEVMSISPKVEEQMVIATYDKREEVKDAAVVLVSESKISTENKHDTVKCSTSLYSVELSNTETKPETIISSSSHISSPLSDAKGITVSNTMSASHSIQPENSFTVVSVLDANEVVSEENQPSVEKEVFSISEECVGMPLEVLSISPKVEEQMVITTYDKCEEVKEATGVLVSESKFSTENKHDTVKCSTSLYSVELSNTETEPETIISSSYHISSPSSDARGITTDNVMSTSHPIQPENSFPVISVLDAAEVVSAKSQLSGEKEVFSISEECVGMPLEVLSTSPKVEKQMVITTYDKCEEVKEEASVLVSESKILTENKQDTVKCCTPLYSVELSNTETIISSSSHISSPLSDAKGITISNTMSASHSIQPENSFTVVSVLDANDVVSEENQPSVEKEVFSISEECVGMPLEVLSISPKVEEQMVITTYDKCEEVKEAAGVLVSESKISTENKHDTVKCSTSLYSVELSNTETEPKTIVSSSSHISSPSSDTRGITTSNVMSTSHPIQPENSLPVISVLDAAELVSAKSQLSGEKEVFSISGECIGMPLEVMSSSPLLSSVNSASSIAFKDDKTAFEDFNFKPTSISKQLPNTNETLVEEMDSNNIVELISSSLSNVNTVSSEIIGRVVVKTSESTEAVLEEILNNNDSATSDSVEPLPSDESNSIRENKDTKNSGVIFNSSELVQEESNFFTSETEEKENTCEGNNADNSHFKEACNPFEKIENSVADKIFNSSTTSLHSPPETIFPTNGNKENIEFPVQDEINKNSEKNYENSTNENQSANEIVDVLAQTELFSTTDIEDIDNSMIYDTNLVQSSITSDNMIIDAITVESKENSLTNFPSLEKFDINDLTKKQTLEEPPNIIEIQQEDIEIQQRASFPVKGTEIISVEKVEEINIEETSAADFDNENKTVSSSIEEKVTEDVVKVLDTLTEKEIDLSQIEDKPSEIIINSDTDEYDTEEN